MPSNDHSSLSDPPPAAAPAATDQADPRLARLTPRERQVMDLAAAGRHNREIGEALGISPRTVEVYKARLMEKLQARNLSELIRFALTADREHAV
jgi:two-component system response regulator FixJ